MENKTEANKIGTIIVQRGGKKKYYYYSQSYKVKIDPNTKGNIRGSKSNVVMWETAA